MDGSSFTNEIAELTKAPSIQLWELEIERVLYGKRDHAIDRLRSVQEYVEVLHVRSTDEGRSRTTFHQALRNVVQVWQSSRPAPSYYFSVMLDLIGAYTPALGFVKILGHILKWGRFGNNAILDSRVFGDLHLKALKVVENYFPTPPALEEESPGFATYVNMLRGLLADTNYSGHALRRLIEFEIVKVTDQEAVDAIRANIETIRELVPLILRTSRRQRASRDLALVYLEAAVTGEGVDAVFAESAMTCHARFEPSRPPTISFENGEVITFYFSAEELEEYSRLQHQELRVQEIAKTIHETGQTSLVEEFTQILEDTLDKSNEEIRRLWRAVGQSGMHLAHGRYGPYLYLPHAVNIRLNLSEKSLQSYVMRVRFGAEPEREVQTFFRNVRAQAADA
jgi:hypothetical protein